VTGAPDPFAPDAFDVDALRQTGLGDRWDDLGVDSSLLTPAIRETQRGQFRADAPTPATAADEVAAAPEHLVDLETMGEVIGQGGMGVVREATQRGLERTVAIKHLHPASGPRSMVALLREARISGLLEHPNIIPVHALTRDHDSPVIVMKRIEGIEWSDLLEPESDPALHTTYDVGDDPLEWHLEVLMRLCRAVHFAHSRHILHLDLKPSNVMIGRFGETYLLDWGVAVSIDSSEERPAWLPSVEEVRSVVGTAAYMSPEQASGEAALFGPQTDVFQLGAMLHQVLTGVPPHESKTLALTLLNAYEAAPPEYDSSVPEELADIARKAMSKEVEDRFASADELRKALDAFLEHRTSTQLVAEANARLKKLLPELRGTIDESLSALELSDEVTIQRRMVECVFAFQQALKIWPENTEAQKSLRELLKLVIARAIESGDLRAAASALADLPEPEPELRAQVAKLKVRLKADRRRKQAALDLVDEVDLNVRTRERAVGAALAGGVWFLWNMLLGTGVRSGWFALDYTTLFINIGVSTAAVSVGTYSLRKILLVNRVNRQAMSILWGGYFTTWALWLAGYQLGLEPQISVALMSVLFVFFFWTALNLDRRVWITGVPTLPLALMSIVDVANVFEWQAACGLATGLALGWIWRNPDGGPAG